MRRTVPSILLATAAVGVLTALANAQAPPQPAATPAPASVTFAKDIEPILAKSCWNCHSADAQLADLDLSTREAALRGGEHGAAIVPGKAEQSRLYRMVAGLESITMPMDGSSLAPAEVAAIKAWIDQGAEWGASPAATATAKPAGANSVLAALENMEITPEQRAYWAFKLPVQKTPPVVSKAGFSHPIDRFLEATRAEKKLVAAPRADKRTLIRRAYIDLIGLPPSPADVEAFVADRSDDAWDKVITKLLALPQYGERWGRHWLDVARYADSNGFEQDYDRPNAWRYRDYVINSFNQDKPYNQFLKEQIAGDELDTARTKRMPRLPPAGRATVREKDNPERPWDDVDDLMHARPRRDGNAVNCARAKTQVRPIDQRTIRAGSGADGWAETIGAVGPRVPTRTYRGRTRTSTRDLGAPPKKSRNREAVPAT